MTRQEYIDALLAEAPPLTVAQRRAIRALFASAAGRQS